jgi:hypothetical protein
MRCSTGAAGRGHGGGGGRLRPRLWGPQARAGGDDRRGAVMDGVDDLGVVDPLQIDAGDPEMGVLDMRVIWQLGQGTPGWSVLPRD